MNRTWWLWITVAGVPLAVSAQTVTLLPSPLELPARIGPLQHDGAPHHFSDPRLGSAWQYDGEGQSLTVYVYDLGIKNIPDGSGSVETCEQFEQAKGDVIQANYPGTEFKSEQLVRLLPPAELPLAREAVYEFKVDGRPAYSYVWITGTANLFMKMRFTADASLRNELPATRRAILTAFGNAVERLQPAAVPTSTEGSQKGGEKDDDKEGTRMVINSMDASQADMSAGLIYLATLSALAEKNPASIPACGGRLVPTYEMELAAFESMLVMQAATPDSTAGKKLAAIEKAGFLGEYVWIDRHQANWGDQAPDGLKLSGYKKWRKKNLRDFSVRDIGAVEFTRPRPLTIEAADAP